MQFSVFKTNGVREIPFELKDSVIETLRSRWMSFAESCTRYPTEKFFGRGIVICAGGIIYFTCAIVAITRLRAQGCNLPIEVWSKPGELTEDAVKALVSLDAIPRVFSDEALKSHRYCLKPLAILRSSFQEVLYLDADNNCLLDPSYLFDLPEFVATGALFWPDFWTTAHDNPIWEIISKIPEDSPEQESGQMLINKEICWRPLQLCLYFNRESNIYYKLLHGDKDTFRFAWLALDFKFTMINKPVGVCGHIPQDGKFTGNTMIQFGVDGNPLFMHRNLKKWYYMTDFTLYWTHMRTFTDSAAHRNYILDFTNANEPFLAINGDVAEENCDAYISQYEIDALKFLEKLKKSAAYLNFTS